MRWIGAPVVSVIIPAYNAKGSISDAIESLKRQTFEGFEAIIVNDGSIDSTEDEASVAIGDDSRFCIHRQPNGGVSSARNLGLEYARGDWVTFLDADDVLAPMFLGGLLGRAARDIDIVIAGAKVIGGSKRPMANSRDCVVTGGEIQLLASSVLDGEDNDQIGYCASIAGCICSKIYRRASIDATRFDIRVAMREDALFNLSALCGARNVALSTRMDYIYRTYRSTASVSFHPRFNSEIDAFLEVCQSIWTENGLPVSSYHKGVLSTYMSWLKLYALHRDASFSARERFALVSESLHDERWGSSFEALRDAKLDASYSALRHAYRHGHPMMIAALKYANDLRRLRA